MIALSKRQQRARQLYDELTFAVGRIERATLKDWSQRSALRLLSLATRRVGGVAQLGRLLGRVGARELSQLWIASRQRRLFGHVGDRAAAAVDSTVELGNDGAQLVMHIGRAIRANPRQTAPAVLGALLGFGAGSGGLDGNGGIPDLDLLLGIDAHRSLLTHSVLAGIVVEGLILALADLAAEVHGQLPHDHDALWDALAKAGAPLAGSLAMSASAGLAWHLLVDALIQPGAYHDLPFSMPMEGHQTVLAANGLAEGVDAAQRARQVGSAEVAHDLTTRPSPSQRAVAALSGVAESFKTRWRRAGT